MSTPNLTLDRNYLSWIAVNVFWNLLSKVHGPMILPTPDLGSHLFRGLLHPQLLITYGRLGTYFLPFIVRPLRHEFSYSEYILLFLHPC